MGNSSGFVAGTKGNRHDQYVRYQRLGRRSEIRQGKCGRQHEGVWRRVEECTGDRGRDRRLFEEGTAAVEKLFGAKSVEKAIEIQQDYLKSAYEGFVAQATKLGELYVDLAKETYKPYEGYLSKLTPAK